MPIGPIFSVELITSGRRARFVLTRAAYAALLFLALGLTYWSFEDSRRFNATLQDTSNFAAQFFAVFTWVQMFAVVVLGPALTAGTIAQERERRTLECLFASDLRDTEIVFSKFFSRVLHIVYLVLAGLPVLALASWLGGIDPQYLALVFLLAASTMFTVAAVSILVSVRARSAREAITGAYVILFAWWVLPLLVGIYISPLFGLTGFWFGPLEAISWLIVGPNPLWAIPNVFEISSGGGAAHAWGVVGTLVASQFLVIAGCLAGAVWSLRRVQRKAPAAGPRRRFRLPVRRPPLRDDAMLWKELHADRSRGRLGSAARVAQWLIAIVVVGITVWGFFTAASMGGGREAFGVQCTVTSAILGTCIVLLTAARAAASITSEKERDCWTVLLGTDLTGSEIVRAKVLGNLASARGPAALLASVWLLATLQQPLFILPAAFTALPLVAACWFASSLGVAVSLRAKTSMRAMAATAAIVFMIGGGYWFCCFPMLFGVSGPGSEEALFLFMSPCVPYLLTLPGVAFLEGNFWNSGESVAAIIAYALGTVGYFIAAGVISGAAVLEFERLSGRITPGFRPQPPPSLRAYSVERDHGIIPPR